VEGGALRSDVCYVDPRARRGSHLRTSSSTPSGRMRAYPGLSSDGATTGAREFHVTFGVSCLRASRRSTTSRQPAGARASSARCATPAVDGGGDWEATCCPSDPARMLDPSARPRLPIQFIQGTVNRR